MDPFDDQLKERGAALKVEILSLQEIEVQDLSLFEGFIQIVLEGRTSCIPHGSIWNSATKWSCSKKPDCLGLSQSVPNWIR